MQLFYAPDITTPLYTLPEEESKHAVRVLRMAVGGTLHLTDGRGNMYTARVADANPKRCVVEVTATQTEIEKRGYNLTMAVAPTKNNDRYDWFLEKATEVGVDVIIPVDCRHSERHNINLDRQNKVITSAVKQSLKAYHPTLKNITPFKDVVTAKFEGRKLIAHCGVAVKEKKPISNVAFKGDKVLIMIGPEGDFSPEEVKIAVAAGFDEITLGDARLRTETAALAAVMYISFINGLNAK